MSAAGLTQMPMCSWQQLESWPDATCVEQLEEGVGKEHQNFGVSHGSNKKLLGTSASLLVTSALLVYSNKKLLGTSKRFQSVFAVSMRLPVPSFAGLWGSCRE